MSALSAFEITRRLGGDWLGRFGLCPGPGHSDRDRSMKVYDRSDGLGIGVHSFAGDDWKACKDHLAERGLIEDSRRRLTAEELEQAQRRREAAQRKRLADAARNRAWAKRIWEECRPGPGSLVDRYLTGRGIQNIPADIAFHPSLPHKPTGLRMPAMVALVRDADRHALAVHRTYLDDDGRKIAGAEAKMALGLIEDGAVQLRWPQGDILALSEGIENAASIMALYAVPCWATLGSHYACSLPAHVRRVVIFEDLGKAGEAAAENGRDFYGAMGLEVEVRRPWNGDGWSGDWNDILREASR